MSSPCIGGSFSFVQSLLEQKIMLALLPFFRHFLNTKEKSVNIIFSLLYHALLTTVLNRKWLGLFIAYTVGGKVAVAAQKFS